MTIDEACQRREVAKKILKRYTVPGKPLTLVEDAPPEAEEALKVILDWLEVNRCEWD